MSTRPELLVVAGETSGDRMAAAVLEATGDRFDAWGVGGDASAAAGLACVSDARSVAAMGVLDVARRGAALGRAAVRVVARVRRAPPAAALLVDYTEANARLGRWLRGRGVRVVWCGAPQVWAWRPGRTGNLARAADVMAVLLPFEPALWREHGVEAHFVGHPAAEAALDARATLGRFHRAQRAEARAGGDATTSGATGPDRRGDDATTSGTAWPDRRGDDATTSGTAWPDRGDADAAIRAAARAALALPPGPALAVLPGSRSGEVDRLGEALCDAAARLGREAAVGSARLLRAPGLPDSTGARLAATAARHGIPLIDVSARAGVASLLPAFDLALCASGTASLEAALAGAAPVVTYRLDALAWQIAQRLVITPHIALANVVLGRRAFPELLQDEVTPARVVAAARAVLATTVASGEARTLAATLRERLAPPGARFGLAVAALL